MSSFLTERAEDYSLVDISRLDVMNGELMRNLESYLFSDENSPRVVLGPKGSGKTFTLRKVLTRILQKDREFLPAMFIYKKSNRLELLDPLLLAPPEIWGNRLEVVYSQTSAKDLMNKASFIGFDDVHYISEAVLDGVFNPRNLIRFLSTIVEEVGKGKKTVIVAEKPLAYYAEHIDDRELDSILPHFGERNPKYWWQYKDVDAIAQLEVYPLGYPQWLKFAKNLHVKPDPNVNQILYNLTPNPRSFVKFSSQFEGGEEVVVDMQEFQNRAQHNLDSLYKNKSIDHVEYVVNSLMAQNPVIKCHVYTNDFDHTFKRLGGVESLEFAYKVLPSLSSIKEEFQNKLKQVYASEYAAMGNRLDAKRRLTSYAFRTKPGESWQILKNVVESYPLREGGLSEPPTETVGSLAKVFVTDMHNLNVKGSYQTLKNLETSLLNSASKLFPQMTESEFNGYLKRIAKNAYAYFIDRNKANYVDYGKWLAVEPFFVAFREKLLIR